MRNSRADVPAARSTGLEILEPRVLLSGAAETTTIEWFGHDLEVIKDSWIIGFDDYQHDMGALNKTAQVLSALGVKADAVKPIARGSYVQVITKDPINSQRALATIDRLDGVLSIAPNTPYTIDAPPNDPLFGDEYFLQNVGQLIPGSGFGTPGADIHVTDLWDQGFIGSRDIVVAVIDTGVDWTHPDLAANIWRNPGEIPGNGIDDDGNGFIDDIRGWDFGENDNDPMDVFGHGTAVAGNVGAVGNNSIGVVGVNWTVSILPIKIADAFGGLSAAAIIASHDYLTDLITNHGINIVASNNSYGAFAPDFYEELPGGLNGERTAIERFVATGATFVASAGNNGADNDADFAAFPATYNIPELISVAATDNNDALAGFSNWGVTTVDLGAPGVRIRTTAVGGGYQFIDGTSFSGPITAGAVGLLKSIKPDASQEEIKRALLLGVDPVPALQGLVVSGGRLNVTRAAEILLVEGPVVNAVSPGVVSGPVSVVTVQFSKPIDPAFVTPAAITLARSNGDGVFGDGDDILINIDADDITVSGMTLTIDLGQIGEFPVGFPVDFYRLVLDDAGFRDFEGNFLNGDLVAGVDETYDFRIINISGAFEPNDRLLTATPATFNTSGIATFPNARIGDGVNTVLDVDIYRFNMSTSGLITLDVLAKRLTIPSTLDSYLRLFNAAGLEIAVNDNFAGLDSRIEVFVPTGGTYYVGVSGFGNETYNPMLAASGSAQSQGDYTLTVRVDLVAEENRTFDQDAASLPIDLPAVGVIEDSIFVPDIRNVVDLNVRLAIEHPFMSDLRVWLISPQGTTVPLALSRGGANDGYGFTDGTTVTQVTFNDEAVVNISAATPTMLIDGRSVFVGSFRPESPLNTVDGQSALGNWTLRIQDDRVFDAGRLLSWGIDVTLVNEIFGPFEVNDTLGTATDLFTPINGVGTQTIQATIGDGAFGRRDVDMFAFAANPGTTITIAATPTTGQLDIVARLFDVVGNELILSDLEGTSSASISYVVDPGGLFFIGISGAGNTEYNPVNGGSGLPTDSTGGYSLTISVVGGLGEQARLLEGTRVALGVAPDGSLTAPNNPIGRGIRLDGNEFLLDRDDPMPVESFYGGTFDGISFINAGASGGNVPMSLTTESDAANQRIAVDGLFQGRFVGREESTEGGLEIRRVISFGNDDDFIAIDVTLTNTSLASMSNVAWMEAFNPNQGINQQTGIRRTVNDVDATGRLVSASFFDNNFLGGLTIALAAADVSASGIDVVAAVMAPQSIRDPYQILDNTSPDPDGSSTDSLIALAYGVDTLGSAQSVSFRYFVLLGASLDTVNTRFDTIEAGSGDGHLVPDPQDPALDPADLPYTIYYPEGFANSRASTFIPVVNANKEDARVVIIARYEVGDRDHVLFDSAVDNASGVIAASTRAGITVTTPALYAAGTSTNVQSQIVGRLGIRKDTPYSIEIHSSQPVAANLSHFDFGIATGEAFTSHTSTTWTFGEGFKGDNVNDFLIYQNTSDQRIKVTLTVYQENTGQVSSTVQTVDPLRRGGWNLDLMNFITPGPFAVRLDSEAPIVAALSHFDSNIGGGYAIIGTVGIGSTSGASPEGEFGVNADAEFVTILNANNSAARITFTFSFANGAAYRQTLTVGAQRRGGLDISKLNNFPVGDAFAISYTSDVPVTVNLPSFSYGEATGSAFASAASTNWLFADGFRPASGANVVEYLRLYNPAAGEVVVEIALSFTDGSSETFFQNVAPRSASEFDVHDFVTGDRRLSDAFYGIRVRAATPIVAFLGRFDLFLGGGFGTLGTPLGQTGVIG